MSYILINNLSTQMNVSKPRKRVKQTTLLTKVTNKVVLLKEDLQDLMQKNQELTERNNTLEEENKSYINRYKHELIARHNVQVDHRMTITNQSKKIVILEDHQKVLSKEIKLMQTTIASLKNNLKDQEEELKTRNNALAKIVRNNIELISKNQDLTRELEEKTPGHCLICHETTATCVSMCGHFICCEGCLKQHVWENKLPNCPKCRQTGIGINRNTVSMPVQGTNNL